MNLMSDDAPNMMKRANGQKALKPPALKLCLPVNRIFVLQFRMFDNGPKLGMGKTRRTRRLKAHLEPKSNLRARKIAAQITAARKLAERVSLAHVAWKAVKP